MLPYPKSVFFIVSNEFCERFCFYGMRAILAIYLREVLLFSTDSATIVFHAFVMFCYFFPLIGAIIADSFLGKFKTILYLSLVYALGSILISFASSPGIGLPQTESSLIGLLLIAVGTGGIKPCVSAFGGDQFTLPQQAAQLASFFSIFYFAINAGSLLSTFLTPVFREDVHCGGLNSCYPLAFGVPAALMVTAVVIFVLGKRFYVTQQPQGNVVVKVANCITHAVVRKVTAKGEKRQHWLEFADDKYSSKLISDTKSVLSVMFLFLPLPLFWALFDQQGSRWTFQAQCMDGTLGWYTLKPDQMQVINPVLILAFIPLFETVLYPTLKRLHLLTKPLQKLSLGGILAGVAFLISGFLELHLQHTFATLPSPGYAQLRLYNGLSCNITLNSSLPLLNNTRIAPFGNTKLLDISAHGIQEYTVSARSSCEPNTRWDGSITVTEKESVSYYITKDSTLSIQRLKGYDQIKKPESSRPYLRIIHKLPAGSTLYLSDGTTKRSIPLDQTEFSTEVKDLKRGMYSVYVDDVLVQSQLKLETAGVYSLVVQGNNGSFTASMVTVSPPNTVHMLWLLPQYIVMTAAEVMFSVTGLEFSFTQAPISMKSVLSSCWLLTVAFGNLIVVIISKLKFFDSQAKEFFLFATLMFLDMGVFIIIALKYRYVSITDEQELPVAPTNRDGLKNGVSNKSYTN